MNTVFCFTIYIVTRWYRRFSDIGTAVPAFLNPRFPHTWSTVPFVKDTDEFRIPMSWTSEFVTPVARLSFLDVAFRPEIPPIGDMAFPRTPQLITPLGQGCSAYAIASASGTNAQAGCQHSCNHPKKGGKAGNAWRMTRRRVVKSLLAWRKVFRLLAAFVHDYGWGRTRPEQPCS